jgi:SAM-dependent methyltransferase
VGAWRTTSSGASGRAAGCPTGDTRASTRSWPRTAASRLSSLETHILPLVPGLTERLARGIRVADIGCGSGRILNRLAELYPRARFVGFDLSAEAIGSARREAARKGLRNVEFVVRDLSDFDRTAEPAAFDFVTTFDAVHDQARPLQVLQGIHRALNPDGVYLMQDIRGTSRIHDDTGLPLAPLLYTVSCMHCMTVSLAQGGEGLGARGGGDDAPVSGARRVPVDPDAPAGPRRPEQLVRGGEVTAGGAAGLRVRSVLALSEFWR